MATLDGAISTTGDGALSSMLPTVNGTDAVSGAAACPASCTDHRDVVAAGLSDRVLRRHRHARDAVGVTVGEASTKSGHATSTPASLASGATPSR